jgi:hypothetical protein
MVRFGGVVLAAAVLFASPSSADVADAIARDLEADGYTNIQVERTLLGRIRVTGEGQDGTRREVVVDRGTGEILRDLVEPDGGQPRE